MTLIGKTGFIRDQRNGLSICQELFRPVDSHLIQICVGREPNLFGEGPHQPKRTKTGEACQLNQTDVLLIMLLDEVTRQSYRPVLVSHCRDRRRIVGMAADQLERRPARMCLQGERGIGGFQKHV